MHIPDLAEGQAGDSRREGMCEYTLTGGDTVQELRTDQDGPSWPFGC